jgi:hypothetical protein
MRATYLHYENGKGYDVIDFIKDYELNFNRGNIIKYICRSEYLREQQQQWIEKNK